MPIEKIKFNQIKEYLESQNVFGLTVQKRKHILIYTFERYYNSTIKLVAKVKVMRKTKYVMSAKIRETIYTDYDKFKKEIEKKHTPTV